MVFVLLGRKDEGRGRSAIDGAGPVVAHGTNGAYHYCPIGGNGFLIFHPGEDGSDLAPAVFFGPKIIPPLANEAIAAIVRCFSFDRAIRDLPRRTVSKKPKTFPFGAFEHPFSAAVVRGDF